MKKLLLFLMLIPFIIKAQDGAYQGYKFKIPQYANTYNRIAFFDTKGYLKTISTGTGYLFNDGSGNYSYSNPSTVTNLATIAGASTVTITSDTGTDALIPAATQSVAGVMTAVDKTKLDGIVAGADNYVGWDISVDAVNTYLVYNNEVTAGKVSFLGGNGVDFSYSSVGGDHRITGDLDIKGLGSIANPDANYNLAIQSNSGSAVRITIGDIENYIGTTAGTASRLAKRDASADLYAHNFILSSDFNLKKNIKPLQNTDWTNKIDFKQFQFKDDPKKKVRFGVIAQDIEKLAPDLVSTDEQGNKAVAYIDLLIAKIVEMDKRIKDLEYKLKEVTTR